MEDWSSKSNGKGTDQSTMLGICSRSPCPWRVTDFYHKHPATPRQIRAVTFTQISFQLTPVYFELKQPLKGGCKGTLQPTSVSLPSASTTLPLAPFSSASFCFASAPYLFLSSLPVLFIPPLIPTGIHRNEQYMCCLLHFPGIFLVFFSQYFTLSHIFCRST